MKRYVKVVLSFIFCFILTFAFSEKLLYKKSTVYQDGKIHAYVEIYAGTKKSRIDSIFVSQNYRDTIVSIFDGQYVVDIGFDHNNKSYQVLKTSLEDIKKENPELMLSSMSHKIKPKETKVNGQKFQGAEYQLMDGKNLAGKVLIIQADKMFSPDLQNQYKKIVAKHYEFSDRLHTNFMVLNVGPFFSYYKAIKSKLMEGFLVVETHSPNGFHEKVNEIRFVDYNDKIFQIPTDYKEYDPNKEYNTN
ncbi:MAG: hypothetical protein RMJ36_07055 [Candidatus Calescibacterium sp.]|nr:hypothetical protein [Candidatus Calescibacterium sp.]MDW8133393.1 hypothetical protein [Candidatus Calescibacterium sp.]